MSTTPERTSTPPPASGSPSPTPKLKSRWSRVGGLVRRSSTAFSLPKRSESPTPSERERESPPVGSPDNGSGRKSTSRPSSLRNVEVSTSLSPPAADDHVTPSPIAESPAREAAELASDQPPVGPSPLAGGVITAEPEQVSAPEDTPAEPESAPAAAESTSAPKPEAQPVREPAPSYTTTVDSDEQQPADPPSIKVEDAEEQPQTAAESIKRAASQRSAQAPSTKAPSVAPTNDTAEIATPTPRAPVPTSGAAAEYFDLPNPHDPPVQPVSVPSDYAAQVWGGDARKGVAAKRSQSSFASSVGWTKPSNAPG